MFTQPYSWVTWVILSPHTFSIVSTRFFFFEVFFFLTVLVFGFSIVNAVIYPYSHVRSAPVCLQPLESVP